VTSRVQVVRWAGLILTIALVSGLVALTIMSTAGRESAADTGIRVELPLDEATAAEPNHGSYSVAIEAADAESADVESSGDTGEIHASDGAEPGVDGDATGVPSAAVSASAVSATPTPTPPPLTPPPPTPPAVTPLPVITEPTATSVPATATPTLTPVPPTRVPPTSTSVPATATSTTPPASPTPTVPTATVIPEPTGDSGELTAGFSRSADETTEGEPTEAATDGETPGNETADEQTTLPTATTVVDSTAVPAVEPTPAPLTPTTVPALVSPTVVPTVIPTETPTAVLDTVDGNVSVNTGTWWVNSSSGGLNLRSVPQITPGGVVAVIDDGQPVTASGVSAADSDGNLWAQLTAPFSGWVSLEFLSATPPVVPTPTPTPTVDPFATPTPTPVPVVQGAGPTAEQWSQVRTCESGGNYAINTGNGYYGAYQFSIQTWNSVARLYYPTMQGILPSDASVADQDKMAQLLYDDSGRGQWPECGRFLP